MVKQRAQAPKRKNPLAADKKLPRTCIIGAGASGLASAKTLYEARVPFDCYEMGPVVGGVWVFNNPTGKAAAYETLQINTSCPRMAFSDFPMPKHFPAYASHDQVASYFEEYVDHFGIRDSITFNTTVTRVEKAQKGWDVTIESAPAKKGAKKTTKTINYDAVIVANGHHWDPRLPEPAYPGTFDGKQMHSHDYRTGKQLEGHDVVVVGSGNSALDIAVEAGNVAKSANISIRRSEWVLRKFLFGVPADQIVLPSWVPWFFTKWRLWIAAKSSGSLKKHGIPDPKHHPGESHPVQSEGIRKALKSGRVKARPGIERLAGDSVIFTDGSKAKADLIVWATGYKVTFPFFAEDFISAPNNSLPLYRRVAMPEHDGLFFVGLLQPVGAVMPLSEAQAKWIAKWLTGEYVPPSKEQMEREMEESDRLFKNRFYASDRHTMEVDFDNYIWQLEKETARGAKRKASKNA